MKRLLAVSLVALFLLPTLVWPQAPIQQTATMLNACTTIAVAQPAISAAGTATATPPAGQYLYLCGLDYQACASGAAPAATVNIFFTTTGLPGLPRYQLDVPATAGVCQTGAFYFEFPLKSTAAGAAVTFVSPSLITNVQFNLNLYGYFAQ